MNGELGYWLCAVWLSLWGLVRVEAPKEGTATASGLQSGTPNRDEEPGNEGLLSR